MRQTFRVREWLAFRPAPRQAFGAATGDPVADLLAREIVHSFQRQFSSISGLALTTI